MIEQELRAQVELPQPEGVSMVTIEQIGKHYLSEVQRPSQDSEQWLASLCLRNLFPSTTYWSMDGYHVHALVDYDRNILWEDDKITTTDRSELIRGVKYFHHCTAQEIVSEWKKTIQLLEEHNDNNV